MGARELIRLTVFDVNRNKKLHLNSEVVLDMNCANIDTGMPLKIIICGF